VSVVVDDGRWEGMEEVNLEGKPSLAEFSKIGGTCETVRFA
jgi:hypothetical protein